MAVARFTVSLSLRVLLDVQLNRRHMILGSHKSRHSWDTFSFNLLPAIYIFLTERLCSGDLGMRQLKAFCVGVWTGSKRQS